VYYEALARRPRDYSPHSLYNMLGACIIMLSKMRFSALNKIMIAGYDLPWLVVIFSQTFAMLDCCIFWFSDIKFNVLFVRVLSFVSKLILLIM